MQSMANKKITQRDRQIVIQRMANGQSTRAAIKGTSISSNQTAARIAKQESHAIAQLRLSYQQKLEEHGLTCVDVRVAQLGQMLFATKTMRVTVPTGRDHFIPVDKRNFFIEVEDWSARFKAIQYIDHVMGLENNTNKINLNVLNQQFNNND